MKTKIKYMIITLVLCITLFSMKEGYACDTDKLYKEYVGQDEQREQLECMLEEQFVFDNYSYWWRATNILNTTEMYICIFDNNTNYRINVSSTSQTWQYQKSDNSWNIIKCIRTTLQNLNGTNYEKGINKWGSLQQPATNTSYTYYSSIDIYNQNDTIQIAKTFTYTKPTCESGGGGPVSINNWPITKEEFYLLIIALCVLIFMLFFKWCFPNTKGGNKK